jgi:hypothetical protein
MTDLAGRAIVASDDILSRIANATIRRTPLQTDRTEYFSARGTPLPNRYRDKIQHFVVFHRSSLIDTN